MDYVAHSRQPDNRYFHEDLNFRRYYTKSFSGLRASYL
ncbi:hypothetical protein NNO_1827 [Hydrogenimonas sp.]|nr:hypothetical protein NNO_1827 [Hydrogenimonas sp.]